eukprot:TRINITY_DN3469_c0_g1_i1.p1 TRINITY_DN3469_c0_g1~~TRINITY_DN3469_c0_g1_i1.p1  ORF type:complete len:257 (-),score=119.28 TRINITY_DN3469_c0_g1_i1:20-790(-)
MSVKAQKKLAQRLLNCGIDKVWLDPTKKTQIEKATSRQEIRQLLAEGIIKRKPGKPNIVAPKVRPLRRALPEKSRKQETEKILNARRLLRRIDMIHIHRELTEHSFSDAAQKFHLEVYDAMEQILIACESLDTEVPWYVDKQEIGAQLDNEKMDKFIKLFYKDVDKVEKKIKQLGLTTIQSKTDKLLEEMKETLEAEDKVGRVATDTSTTETKIEAITSSTNQNETNQNSTINHKKKANKKSTNNKSEKETESFDE